jgi:hypothetical protein
MAEDPKLDPAERGESPYSAAPQAKSEPMPPTPVHPDPVAPLSPPGLEEMMVGANDPQAPRHPAAAGSGLAVDAPVATGSTSLGGPGKAPADERPVPDLATSTGTDTGPAEPVSQTPGESHRAPGLQGATGVDETVETDVESSAAQMGPAGPSSAPAPTGPGDTAGVPSSGTVPLMHSSEEHAAVRGARTPAE